jgi:hypothetical protein
VGLGVLDIQAHDPPFYHQPYTKVPCWLLVTRRAFLRAFEAGWLLAVCALLVAGTRWLVSRHAI